MAADVSCWLFNTDETEHEGREKHELMLEQSCVAAWDDSNLLWAEHTLNRPSSGDFVFFFRAGYGLIAAGKITPERAFASRSIFGQAGEFHRQVEELNIRPVESPITFAEVRNATGYNLPCRTVMGRMNSPEACLYIRRRFNSVKGTRKVPKTITTKGGGFNSDPEERRKIEKLAVQYVSSRYISDGWSVTTVESERIGYDLECKKGPRVEHVEVKGTKGGDLAFIITENEVTQAREDPFFRLSVVTGVFDQPKETVFSGTEFLAKFDRKAIQYFASLAVELVT